MNTNVQYLSSKVGKSREKSKKVKELIEVGDQEGQGEALRIAKRIGVRNHGILGEDDQH